MATSTKKNKTATGLKDRVVDINSKALIAADDIINGSIKTGEKWQKLYTKSLKKSQPIIEKQIDMVFDTAETIIEQYQSSAKRFRQIFNLEVTDTKKKATKVKSAAKKAVKKTTAKTTITAKKAVKQVKKTATKKVTTDLKTISGIGPKMETLLKSAGIKDLAALAAADADKLKAILIAEDTRLNMLNPSVWIEAAKKINA